MSKKQKKKQTEFNASHKGAIDVLRICTVLLAAVSFWATAQGMTEYVFPQEWQSYLASLAIQGILLGLNFYLPSFWRYIKSIITRIGLAMLTMVVLFCSSWFSYIYIVEQGYGKSWNVESQLLIQSEYRRQLYSAHEYTLSYRALLLDNLTQEIIILYNNASALKAQEINPIKDVNWEEEREIYANEDFAAKSEMSTIIIAMESSAQENATANDHQNASEILINMRTNIEAQIKLLNNNVTNAEQEYKHAMENYEDAERIYLSATDEIDKTSLANNVSSTRDDMNNRYITFQEYQNNLDDYQRALSRLQFYETSLGLVSEGSSYSISSSLRIIQKELFNEEPDIDLLESEATSVFDTLQSTIENVPSEVDKYQQLLYDINKFINDLHRYRTVNVSAYTLDSLIEGLQEKDDIIIDNDESWKKEWSQSLTELKALIASLPDYSESENSSLKKYDKATASDELDEMVRLYIADHNAVQQGIIFLLSPYKSLAIFSIILAFFLDVAAFITGILIDSMEQKESRLQDSASKDEYNNYDDETTYLEDYEQLKENYEIVDYTNNIQGLNEYIYLNGDFINIDGKYTYRAVKDGHEIKVSLLQKNLIAGLYTIKNRSAIMIDHEQKLQLVSNPQDGVYKNCGLYFNDGSLSLISKAKDEYIYLTNIPENTPVYIFNNNKLEEIIQASLIDKKIWDTIIIALNSKGTMVIAIYLNNNTK